MLRWSSPFDQDPTRLLSRIKTFARGPFERIKWRILDHFKILPTDERFLSLTLDQILLIIAHMQLDEEDRKNQKADHSETYYDESYDDWEQEQLDEIEQELKGGSNAYF